MAEENGPYVSTIVTNRSLMYKEKELNINTYKQLIPEKQESKRSEKHYSLLKITSILSLPKGVKIFWKPCCSEARNLHLHFFLFYLQYFLLADYLSR